MSERSLYEQAKRITEICKQAQSAKEAEQMVLREFPDMDLKVLRVMAAYHHKFKGHK